MRTVESGRRGLMGKVEGHAEGRWGDSGRWGRVRVREMEASPRQFTNRIDTQKDLKSLAGEET